jgi:pantoate--beta-alanine ligase
MEILSTVTETRAYLNNLTGSIAFVPTMGNLHPGHLSLINKAHDYADHVIVSIFVNPLQFGPLEDFDKYPRTFNADCAALEAANVAAIFAPTLEELYPGDMASTTTVEVPGFSSILCGASRPGHFSGVATVVARLFNIIQPQTAVFGEKDFQQLQVIKRMVNDLLMPINIVGLPTYREADGLAMSSRNHYLSPQERQIAPHLYRVLQDIRRQILEGEHDLAVLEHEGRTSLDTAGFKTDYVTIRDADTLAPAGLARPDWIILAAAHLGKARLIDNLRVSI